MVRTGVTAAGFDLVIEGLVVEAICPCAICLSVIVSCRSGPQAKKASIKFSGGLAAA